MKADLYVQGNFWATVDVPDDGLLALLPKGMIIEIQRKAEQLRQDLDSLDGVQCSISIRYQHPATDIPDTEP
ncbi:hypothetical protein ES708_23730 [subsurface metagenome]